ncbi:phage tail tape measure protein [Muricauda sp. CAU 1633]|uniref:phage tail tape measure protein n=1 Tax=Allomuricauda sp. CAU 1633 TaxID=2816036 RepID=UPI001A8C6D42|nr:phage tail tape measure protein [Muricauda sp. CAU 1633]MBO0323459.1 phage tail tape measure protein [Muricauda sp. CAU 1633]
MAQNDRITEVVSPKAQEQVVTLDKNLRKILATYNELAKAAQKITTPRQANDVLQTRNKLDKEAIEISTKLAKLKKEEANAEAAVQRAIKATNAAQKSASGAKSTNLSQIKSLNSAYRQESRLLNDLRDKYKSLAVQQLNGVKLTRQQANEFRALGTRVRELDRNLKKVDALAGQFNRNVGNYPRTMLSAARGLRALAGAFGFTSGIIIFADIIRKAGRTVAEFDQAQADLAAILGRSRSEITLLTAQAKELGATTAFTATQVAQLQLELAKLGFNDEQILAAAQGVENLAIATGVDAARAAKLAGAAIRGFNLDASEANRVSAALAVSTTKSASSFDTLEVSLPKVSAVAKSFGFTLEDTVALLGSLQNAGFEASIAGTSLRQIFLQLADANGALSKELGGPAEDFDDLIDKFKLLEEGGIDLATAFELTNARSVAAFKTFLTNAESVRELRNAIVDVEDELDELTETKLDSLLGRMTLLNSAWEGFILNLEDGNNVLGNFLKKALEQVTANIDDYRFALDDSISAFDRWRISMNIYSRTWQNFLPFLKDGEGLYAETTKRIIEDTKERQKNALAIQAQTDAYIKMHGSLAPLTEEQQKLSEGSGFSIFTNPAKQKEEVDDFKRTLEFVNEEIKRLRESQKGLTAEDSEQIESISNKIKELEKERDAILNVANANNKLSNYVKGSIGYYEALISKEQEFQKSQATTQDEIVDSQRKINQYTNEVNKLKEALIQLNRVDLTIFSKGTTIKEVDKFKREAEEIAKSLSGTELGEGSTVQFGADAIEAPNTEEINDGLQRIADKYKDITEAARISAEDQKEIFDGLFDTFSNYYRLDLNAFTGLISGKEVELQDYVNSAKSVSNLLLDNQLIRYENEIRANQERLDQILSDDSLSEEEKIKAREVADKKEKEIRNKKAKAERQNVLIQIAIDTAAAVAKVLAQTGVVGPLVIPSIIALGAAQAAFVAAQPLPQFFKGKSPSDNYEGWATVNELPGQREIKIDKHGGVTPYKAGMQLDYVRSSDIIVPSMTTFNRELKDPSSDIFKRLSYRLNHETAERIQMVAVHTEPSTISTEGIRREIREGIKQGFKGVKFPKTRFDNYTQY